MTDSARTSDSPGVRAPSWAAETLAVRPARFPVGHAIRSALAVGGPFVVGALTDHLLTGMWVGLATLLLAAGEREGTYRLNFTIIAVSTPIGAAGYVLGFAQGLPLAALIIVMTMLALLMGLLAGLGPAFSVACMQFLLVASIAIGVDGVEWWQPLGLYFAGAALYALLLAIEMVLDPSRPQRAALEDLLVALADLALARRADLVDSAADRTTRARARVLAAEEAAAIRATELPLATRRTRGWVLRPEVVSAAERVMAFLVGERDPAAADEAAGRLTRLAGLVAGKPLSEAAAPRGFDRVPTLLDARIDELEAAIARPAAVTMPPAVRRARVSVPAISSETVLAAVRLAVCFGIAVGAKAYFPFNHWFWVPLTICLVMKPDFGSVFSRAILRVIGTAAGVVIASVVIAAVPHELGYGVIIAVLAALVPWLMIRSYALQAVVITPIVILLVATISPGEGANYSWQRLGATAIGGAIVIVFGYLLWPHSRRDWVRRCFTQAMTGIAAQLASSGPTTTADRRVDDDRHDELVAARRSADHALTQLQGRLRRVLAEPGSAHAEAVRWMPAADAAERLAASVTAYSAYRAQVGPVAGSGDAAVTMAAAIRNLGREGGLAAAPDTGEDPDLQPVAAALDSLRSVVPAN